MVDQRKYDSVHEVIGDVLAEVWGPFEVRGVREIGFRFTLCSDCKQNAYFRVGEGTTLETIERMVRVSLQGMRRRVRDQRVEREVLRGLGYG